MEKKSRYIYEFDTNKKIWNQVATLVASDASDASEGDSFGTSVSISNNYAIIGAPYKDSQSGSAYVFKRDSNDGWIQVEILIGNDTSSSDYFGFSVSISNDYAIIGAYGNDNGGSAYIFERNRYVIFIHKIYEFLIVIIGMMIRL